MSGFEKREYSVLGPSPQTKSFTNERLHIRDDIINFSNSPENYRIVGMSAATKEVLFAESEEIISKLTALLGNDSFTDYWPTPELSSDQELVYLMSDSVVSLARLNRHHQGAGVISNLLNTLRSIGIDDATFENLGTRIGVDFNPNNPPYIILR